MEQNEVVSALKAAWVVAVIVAICGLFLGGCAVDNVGHQPTASVRSYFPKLDLPEKPQLDVMTPDELAAFRALPSSLQVKLVSNNDKLQTYSKQCEAQIVTYNATADANNKTSDAALGIKPPQTGAQP